MSKELDAEIAVKIFGLEVFWPRYGDSREPWIRRLDGEYIPTEKDRMVPHYSTDIASAWEVIEKLHEKDLWCSLEQCDYEGNKWQCIFYSDNLRIWEDSIAPTAPEAICLAALKTVEVKQ